MTEYDKLKPALQKLVDDGTLTAHQALAAQNALRGSLSTEGRTRKSLFSEALTYIGGAVIVVSAGLLLNQAWDQLGTWGRPAVIGAGAILLFIAASMLSRQVKEDTLRRLSSTLFIGSGALTAFTIGLITSEFWIPKQTESQMYWVNPKPWVYLTITLLCAVGAGLVAWVGYQKANSALGVMAQILTADIAGFAVGALIWVQFFGSDSFPSYGSIVLLTLGALWVYTCEKEKFLEYNAAGVGAILTLLFAIQTFREQLPIWTIPTIEVAGGIGLLALYLIGRKWPFLAGGIGGILIGGVELLTRYVHGVGGALGSMALGIVLLVLGARLFKEHK